MTIRLLLLVALAGGVVWVRAAMHRARANDQRRRPDALPPVPAALRGGGAAWVVFTTPTCAACRTVTQTIAGTRPDDLVVTVDATTDPDLANRWEVRRAPTTLQVDASGVVLARLVGAEAVRQHLAAADDAAGATTGDADSEAVRPQGA